MRGQFNGVGLFYRACPDAFPAAIPAEPGTAGGIHNIIAPLREWEVITHQLERLADRPLLLWHGLGG